MLNVGFPNGTGQSCECHTRCIALEQKDQQGHKVKIQKADMSDQNDQNVLFHRIYNKSEK